MKLFSVCVLALAGMAAAQQPAPQPAPAVNDVRYFTTGSFRPDAAGVSLASVVKGAPYAAESFTEIVQTLADGNRIVNTTTGKMYRDSEGRTRFDQTSAAAGAWVPGDKQFSVSNIDDPVSGEHIMLNNATKQATKFSSSMIMVGPAPEWNSNTPADPNVKAADEAAAKPVRRSMMILSGPTQIVAGMPAPPPPPLPPPGQTAMYRTGMAQGGVAYQVSGSIAGAVFAAPIEAPKRESLGTKTIEGVACTGTRDTMTIPAGAIGNEREIQTVTERWYAADLQMNVMLKTSDPRFGESTFKLTNVVRGEQPKSLFEVPADYTAAEAVAPVPAKVPTKQ